MAMRGALFLVLLALLCAQWAMHMGPAVALAAEAPPEMTPEEQAEMIRKMEAAMEEQARVRVATRRIAWRHCTARGPRLLRSLRAARAGDVALLALGCLPGLATRLGNLAVA